MGAPDANASGYQASEVTARLANLKPDRLLIVHGMADDNVTFEHSTRTFAALQAKALPFEMMVYPGLRHRAGWTAEIRRSRETAILNFFDRKLKGK